MNNSDKSKKQLLKEIELLSTKIGKLEKSESDHKLAENALNESEEKFRILYESSHDAIMMLAPPTWLFTAGNQASIKMFHAKNEKEFISKEPWELSPEYQPDGQVSSDKAKKMIQKAMKTGSNFFEWTHNRINGENFPATVLLTRIKLKDKQLLQATVRDITKRKKIEEELNKHQHQLENLVDERTKELKEEKEYYHSFVTSLNDWVWEMDLKGIHTYSNPAVESILGYKADDVIGHHVSELWLDITKTPKHLKSLKNSLASGKGWKNFSGRFQHKNGSLVYTESAAIPIYNSENKLVGYRGLDHDITVRKQAEEALKESEARWQFAVDGSALGLWDWNIQTNKVFFSKQWKAMLGYEEDEVLGSAEEWDKRVHPDDKEKVYLDLDKHLEDKTNIYMNEHRILCKDNTYKWILDRGKIVSRDEDGKPLRMIGTHTDIAERKKAEDELRKAKDFLENLLETANSIIVTLDINANITTFNKCAEKLSGYTKEEVLGKNWFDIFISPDGDKSVSKVFNKVLESMPDVSQYENSILIKDGKERVINWNNNVLHDKYGNINGALSIGVDVTDRKKAEVELRAGRERLAMLNKIIRHDLSNDFIVIKSAINIFKRTPDPKMLDEIENRVVRSLKTINNYRKYETFINSNIDLDEIELTEKIKNIITDFPKIKLNVDGECRVFADEALETVFANLISNSMKHGKANKIDIQISSKDSLCEVRFMDNGMGIPDKIKDKIFSEGFVYGEAGHTGIGLHIVKKTIERYGGHIYVEDNKPKGAVFVIGLRKVLNITKIKKDNA